MDWFLYDRDLCHERVKGKGSLIDLILTNRKYSFKNTHTFETGRSDNYHCLYNAENLFPEMRTETTDLQRFEEALF